MKSVRRALHDSRALSRRSLLWNGTGLATSIIALGSLGVAVGRSSTPGEAAMDVQGRSESGRLGVPRAPFGKASPLIEPETRRSVGGELRTSLPICLAYIILERYPLSLLSF